MIYHLNLAGEAARPLLGEQLTKITSSQLLQADPESALNQLATLPSTAQADRCSLMQAPAQTVFVIVITFQVQESVMSELV